MLLPTIAILPLVLFLPQSSRAAGPTPVSRAHATSTQPAGVAKVGLDYAAVRRRAGEGPVRLEGFALGTERSATLVLHRSAAARPMVVLAAIAPDGSVQERPIDAPGIEILRGSIEGEPGSMAVLGVRDDGVQGIVTSGGRTWIISSGRFGSAPALAPLAPVSYELREEVAAALDIVLSPCFAEDLAGYAEAADAASAAVAELQQGGVAGPGPCRAVQVAVETDREFTNDLFGGDTGAAADYAYFLLAATSEIYQQQLDARIEVNFVRLWTWSDPWNADNTSAQLTQFQEIWNVGMTWLERDLGHFLSGRSLGGGIAWLNAICSGSTGYGLSANLNGSFPYPIEDHSSQNWDLMVVAHELGHNFGAPHTHSYTPPLDGCGNGNCAGAWGGTIMSYCHACPGGLSNLVMSLHPQNVSTMKGFLSSITCPAIGDPTSAQDDLASVAGTLPITIDVLQNDFDLDCGSPSILAFDAVSAAGGSVSLAPGAGADGRDALAYVAPEGFSGMDSFGYTIATAGGQQSATVHPEVFALLPALPAAVFPSGLRAKYFALSDPVALPDFDLLNPIASEVVAGLDYPSTGGVFAGSGLADNVGALFSGYFYAPHSGLFTLSLESDDGSRLSIGDTVVVNNDFLHPMVEVFGKVALEKGWHPLRVEFFERGGGAGLIARMQSADVLRKVIPGSWLAHGVIGDLDGDGVVGGGDLGLMLALWGTAGTGGAFGSADLDGNGVVEGADIGLLLSAWSGG
jgi:hypothetical protein